MPRRMALGKGDGSDWSGVVGGSLIANGDVFGFTRFDRTSAWQWGRALICNGLERAWMDHQFVNLVLPSFTARKFEQRRRVRRRQPTTRGQEVMGTYFGFTCLDRLVFGANRHSGQKSTVECWSDSRRQPIVSVAIHRVPVCRGVLVIRFAGHNIARKLHFVNLFLFPL